MKFRLGPVYDADERIKREFLDFSKLWRQTCESWNDGRREEFQRTHLDPIPPSMNRFAAELQEFTDLVRSADRALEDERDGGERLE